MKVHDLATPAHKDAMTIIGFAAQTSLTDAVQELWTSGHMDLADTGETPESVVVALLGLDTFAEAVRLIEVRAARAALTNAANEIDFSGDVDAPVMLGRRAACKDPIRGR